MAHNVFISYSTKDKPVADAVCAALEADQVRCWIAPRDVLPGLSYGQAIIEALNESRLLVLIFTADSNTSRHVMREVERAVNKGMPIVPFRVQDVQPTPTMEYFISADHWLDAMTPPLDGHIRRLVETVKQLQGREVPRAVVPLTEHQQVVAPPGELQPAAPQDERRPAAPPPPPPDAFATTPLAARAAAPRHEVFAPQATPSPQASRRPLLVVGLIALAGVAVLAVVLAFFVFGGQDAPPAAAVSGAAGAGPPRSAGRQRAEQSSAAQEGGSLPPRLVLEGHAEEVRVCAFSPDGRVIASGGDDKTVRLWDAETGELTQTLADLEAPVISLAFSPDGLLLAVGLNYSSDQNNFSLHVFDVSEGRAGEIRQTWTNPQSGFTFVAFSADGKTLLGGARPAMLWNTEDWSLKNESIDPGINPAFALSPDGRLLATGGTNENPVKLWDAETGALKLTLEGHEKGVLSLAFSPDGRTLASGSYDDTARLWDTRTGQPKLTLTEEEQNAVFSSAFSPDGRTVASGTYHWVKLWDAQTGALKQKLAAGGMGITSRLAFSPDGKTLAGASDKSVKLWDVGR